MTAPVHVWTPGQVRAPEAAHVALMPIAGDRQITDRLEQAFLRQRPAARADVALFTGEQLASLSPIRLASTAAMSSDLAAIQSARKIGADFLLHGEVLSSTIQVGDEVVQKESKNMNIAFFQRLGKQREEKYENVLMAWRVMDGSTGETLGTHTFNFNTEEAKKEYPDLVALHADDSDFLIEATAREAWKLISPTVAKERIRLAMPWIQPGAWSVRRGVWAARRGDWQSAEQYFERATHAIGPNAAAHHNLAIAYAAKEDFSAAKEELGKATGISAFRLPGDTLFWLDQKHRQYHEAHGLPRPTAGWAFPEPIPQPAVSHAKPIRLEELPWWSSIPFVDAAIETTDDQATSEGTLPLPPE